MGVTLILGLANFSSAQVGGNYMISFSYGSVGNRPLGYAIGEMVQDIPEVSTAGFGVTIGHWYTVPSFSTSLVDSKLDVTSTDGMSLVYGINKHGQPEFFSFTSLSEASARNLPASRKLKANVDFWKMYTDFDSLINFKKDEFKKVDRDDSLNVLASDLAETWNVDAVMLNFYIKVTKAGKYELGLIVTSDVTGMYYNKNTKKHAFTKWEGASNMFLRVTHADIHKKVPKLLALGVHPSITFDKAMVIGLLKKAISSQRGAVKAAVRKSPRLKSRVRIGI